MQKETEGSEFNIEVHCDPSHDSTIKCNPGSISQFNVEF